MSDHGAYGDCGDFYCERCGYPAEGATVPEETRKDRTGEAGRSPTPTAPSDIIGALRRAADRAGYDTRLNDAGKQARADAQTLRDLADSADEVCAKYHPESGFIWWCGICDNDE